MTPTRPTAPAPLAAAVPLLTTRMTVLAYRVMHGTECSECWEAARLLAELILNAGQIQEDSPCPSS